MGIQYPRDARSRDAELPRQVRLSHVGRRHEAERVFNDFKGNLLSEEVGVLLVFGDVLFQRVVNDLACH